jgi:hypothetical protein
LADQIDVEAGLVNILATALYPSGPTTPTSPSVIGTGCQVRRGWPTPKEADDAFKAGIALITIYPSADRNTTRAMLRFQTSVPPTPKITLSVSQNVITLGGSIQAGDLACVKTARAFFPVQVTSGQTLAQVASAFAASLASAFPGTTSTGAVVTVATSETLLVANGGMGTAWLETRRQKQLFQITAWCPTPTVRDALGPFIKTLFSNIERFGLPDNSFASIGYDHGLTTDRSQLQQCYRRDFFYSVEYPTTETQQFPSITAFAANTTGGISPVDTPSAVVTVV